jgi:two-component system sensor histidine kinase AtoS
MRVGSTREIDVDVRVIAATNRVPEDVVAEGKLREDLLHVFDLREVIREIVVLLAPQARGQRVEMRIQLPEGAVSLQGYRDRLKQALLNIAINGLEAMPGGGRLAIDLDARAADASVRIADSGAGIPEELLDEVDQIYFTTKKSGSGIGLYVAQLVVESHGGEIVVQSEPGAGVRFTVNLPLRNQMSGGANAAAGGFS